MVDRRGIEPRPQACKAHVLPLSLSAHIIDTLLPMCVLKSSLTYFFLLKNSLIRYHFTHLGYRPRLTIR